MVACPFYNGYRTRVPHAETFSDHSIDVDLARCGTVKQCVSAEDILFGLEAASGWGNNNDFSAGESLAQIIVGITLDAESDPLARNAPKL